MHSLGKSLNSWGWIRNSMVYSDTPSLYFYFSVKINYQKITSPVNMFLMRENTSVCPIQQGTPHGKEGRTWENAQYLMKITKSHTFSSIWVRTGGNSSPHIVYTFWSIFFKGTPHSWYDLTQFRSKISRIIQLISVVHVNERSMNFCIIICAVISPLLFTSQYEITRKLMKY